MKTNKQFEYKALEMSLKDVDTKSGIVTGYYAAFDNVDSYGDMIIKGAFKKTIAERGPEGTKQIKHLWQHDAWRPIGIPVVLKEDKFGLYFESKFSEIQQAQDCMKLYAEGILNEHSIGYRTIKEEFVDAGKQSYVKLLEVKLWEGSTVTWGANSQTPFTGFKSEKKEDIITEIDGRMKKLQSVLKVGSLSDETLEQCEIELLKLHEAYKSLIVTQPSDDTEGESRQKSLQAIAEILTIK